MAVGSVINLDFPILYVLNGNKELILTEWDYSKSIASGAKNLFMKCHAGYTFSFALRVHLLATPANLYFFA